MASYEDFLDDVRPSVSEAPDPLIISMTKRIVIEFCRRTRIYRTGQAIQIPLVAEKDTYDVPVPAQTVMDQVLGVTIGDDNDAKWSLSDRRNIETRIPEIRQTGLPRSFSHPFESNTIAIYPAPLNVDHNLHVKLYAVLIPTRRSTRFPDEIAEQWYDGILDGIRYRMMIQPGKPWSNEELAIFHKNEYYKAVSDARSKANSDGWGKRYTNIPKFF